MHIGKWPAGVIGNSKIFKMHSLLVLGIYESPSPPDRRPFTNRILLYHIASRFPFRRKIFRSHQLLFVEEKGKAAIAAESDNWQPTIAPRSFVSFYLVFPLEPK
mmetsp:Transcript_20535/g.38951  ORF Transcript_20535/g.38951 Transcript_20535/m.38951 type:complete len:104 (-) Transcript_20535:804-1115(-)|eukprot:scaffold2671_cov167-Amphora_coffeaeformis.AAC.3